MGQPFYKRIVLKLSGEALAGQQGYGIDSEVIASIAQQVKEVVELNVEVAIVVGGGNIWRGIAGSAKGMDRATADYMGMLATVMNSLALQDALENIDVPTRVQTSITMQQVAEPYIRRRAMRHLEKGRVVIFAAGQVILTSQQIQQRPYEQLKLKLKLFSWPKIKWMAYIRQIHSKIQQLKKFETLTYMEVISNNLGVMDSTASSLCMDNNIPLVVFNITEKGNIKRVVLGEKIGTTVKGSV